MKPVAGSNAKLRKMLRFVLPFAVVPILAAVGVLAGGGRFYIAVSFAVAISALVFFATGFEKRKTGTRRLVAVSVMVALSALGRFIPIFKPVTALTVITGAWLGGEAGFLAGALSALISNIWFGQGPWTPFQMLAWGLIGLFAGYLSAPLKKSRTAIVIYGVASGAVFSMIMDVWTVMWISGGEGSGGYMAAVVSALPFTAMYCASNAAFLFFIARPFGEKLNRVKTKYGI